MAPPTVFPVKPVSPLGEEEWKLISRVINRAGEKGGRPCADCRRSLEGMRWVASTGKPWVDMPAEFGNSATVRRYYARLRKRGVIAELLDAFPERASKNNSETRGRAIARRQLECLRNLTERRPRGAAAASARQF